MTNVVVIRHKNMAASPPRICDKSLAHEVDFYLRAGNMKNLDLLTKHLVPCRPDFVTKTDNIRHKTLAIATKLPNRALSSALFSKGTGQTHGFL